MSALLLALALQAATQTSTDVVVMRRAVSKPVFDSTHWDQGLLIADAPACSAKASATREVKCVDTASGEKVRDDMCRGARPDDKGTVEDRRACTYQWNEPAMGPYLEACSDATYKQRTITCQRYGDGAPTDVADETLCAAVRPKAATREPAVGTIANYSGCTHAWKPISGTCTGGKRGYTYTCDRSGGTAAPGTVADTWCTAARPPAQVDDASCGPPDLIVNGGFENGVTGWSLSNAGLSTSGYSVKSGQFGIETYGAWATIRQPTDLIKRGKTYRVTFYANTLNATGYVYFERQGSSGIETTFKTGFDMPPSKVQVDFTVPANGYPVTAVGFTSQSNLRIDDISVIELP